MNGPGMRAVVITCSDSVSDGSAPDESGPLAADLLGELGHEVAGVIVVPDESSQICSAVVDALAKDARIVVLTGGTGAGPRDVTPEALRSAGLRELPGFGEAIRAASRDRVPTTDLSRSLGGTLGGGLVLALPGSPGGVRDGLHAVGGILQHAAQMARGAGHAERGVLRQRHTCGRPGAAAIPDSTRSLVSADPLDQAIVTTQVQGSAAGAVVSFTGVVRDHDGDRAVTWLRYESHPDAGLILDDVLAEARRLPGVLGAAARHRVGDLQIGDVAFAAAVSAAHRSEAFHACAWLVDAAKERLPIWKHQHFADGSTEWVNSP